MEHVAKPSLACKWFDRNWTEVPRPAGEPVRASEVEVSTSAYEFAHGKMPRGRGGWMFDVRVHGCPAVILQVIGSATYGDAKRAAVAEAALAGIEDLAVAT